MSDRTALIKEFQDWRESQGLGFNRAFVPRKFDSMQTLEHEYWLAESEAKDAAKGAPRGAPALPAPQANGARYVTQSDLADALEAVGVAMGQHFKEDVEPRLAMLESEWGGVWEAGRSYKRGNVVAHSGSGWIAVRDYPERTPGAENSGWKLFAKRGRFSK